MEEKKYQPSDYKSDQYVRWCPGCGDHAILNVLHKAMAELGVAPERTAVISGKSRATATDSPSAATTSSTPYVATST